MLRTILSALTIASFVLQAPAAFAVGRLQDSDFKTLSQIQAAGGTAAQLLNDSKIYVGSNGINDTLSNAIINGQIGGAGGGAGGIELLTNPGFESGGVTSGWTATGLTAAVITSGNNLIAGNKTAALTATAVGQTFKSAALPIKGLAGGNCSASLYYLVGGNTGDWSLTVTNGTTTLATLALPPSTSAATPATVTYACGTTAASTLQFVLTSTVASPSVLYFDNAHVGSYGFFTGLVNGQPTNIVRYLSGSGTYVPSAGVTSIEVIAVGGGGGGGASGTSAGSGGTVGGTTTFGTILTATGGGLGGWNGTTAGAGGTATVTAPAVAVISVSGGPGGGATYPNNGTATQAGGYGGSNPLGGAGGAGGANYTNLPAIANTGGGGAGSSGGGGNQPGVGGGAGAYIDAIITAPAASYAYSVGVAGVGQTTANAGSGGAGGSGVIIIRESFQQVTQQAFLPSNGGIAAGQVTGTFATTCPVGTLLADGSAISRTQYPALFAAMGTTYGTGDGSTTFNLPNAQGAFLRGAGSQTFGGITYTGTQGTAQADALQGHIHGQTLYANGVTNTGAYAPAYAQQNFGSGSGNNNGNAASTTANGITAAVTDGTNGTPRLSAETRPFNISLKYCVQTVAASAAPLVIGTVQSTDNTAGTTFINTSQTYTAAATIPNTIETAFGNTTSAAFTLTLPDPTVNKSKKLIISKTNSGANLLGVTGNIAGTASRTTYLLSQSDNITLQSDGTTWQFLVDPYRSEYAYLGPACTSSPCSITASSGGVGSVTRTSTGTYSINFQSGYFSGQIVCSVVANNNANGNYTYIQPQTSTATAYSYTTTNGANGGSATDSGLQSLICRGAR